MVRPVPQRINVLTLMHPTPPRMPMPRLALQRRVRIAQDTLAEVIEAVHGVGRNLARRHGVREGGLEGYCEVGLVTRVSWAFRCQGEGGRLWGEGDIQDSAADGTRITCKPAQNACG